MLFSGKENVFMCLVAFQKNFWKIFSGVWKRRRKRQNPEKHGQNPEEHGAISRSARCFVRSRSRERETPFVSIAISNRDRRRDLAKHHSRQSPQCFAINGAVGASRSTARLWALLFSLARPQFWKSFEVKIGTEMNFRGQRYYFTVNWKWFPENSIFQTNQTAYFTENDFLKPFSPKTNTPLVMKLLTKKFVQEGNVNGFFVRKKDMRKLIPKFSHKWRIIAQVQFLKFY